MAIPRLEPSANPITVPITVNVNLRPYFEIWFQRMRQSGETPEQFALRILKTAALNDYLSMNITAETDAIEQAKTDATAALNSDIELIATEVD